MSETQELERFSAGEQFAVNPDAIERELASLWRTAGRSSGSDQPVTRACLWNVVVHVEERARREGGGDAQALIDMVNALPRHLAARALVMRTRDDAAAASSNLEAWISANCILSGDGGKLVCSEEITLASRGDGDRLLPSLVRALLVPAVPTAAVFEGVPVADDAATTAIVRLADRIVVHADHSHVDRPLTRVAQLVKQAPASAIDVGWLFDRGLRLEIAALFDPPRLDSSTASIDHVEVLAPPSRRWSVRLLMGWVASALRAKGAKAEGPNTWRMTKRNGHPLTLVHREEANQDGISVRISIPAESTTVEVCTTRSGTIDITDDHGTVRQPRVNAARAALVARALTSRGQDQPFSAALAIAETLS